MYADHWWLTFVSLEHKLGIAVACMPTVRPLFTSVTKSAQNRWHYWTERSSEGRSSTTTRRFGGQKRRFENIEEGSSELVPMQPKIQITRLIEVISKSRTESNRVPGVADPVTPWVGTSPENRF